MLHIHLRRISGISPGRRSKIHPELQLITYCRVFPREDGNFHDSPAHLIVVSLLGGFMESAAGLFGLRRVAIVTSKVHTNYDPGGRSVLLCGRPRRVQIKASCETSTAYKGDAVAAGPPAAGG